MAGCAKYRFVRHGDMYDWQYVERRSVAVVPIPLDELLHMFTRGDRMPGAVLVPSIDDMTVKLLTGWDDFIYCTIESDPPQYLVSQL